MKRVLTVVLFLVALVSSAAQAATVTVNAANLSSGSTCGPGTCLYAYTHPVWFFYNDETDVLDNGLGSFVTGPATPLTGRGSAQISVSGSQRRNLATYQFGGTLLSAITSLSYTTYNPSAGNSYGPNASAYLNFNADFNGSNTWQRRLIYLPKDNGAVVANTWKTWDCLNGGAALWEYSGGTWPASAIPGSTPRTWSAILAAYPGIRVLPSDPWLGMRVGEPYAAGYTENIDNFTLGTASGTTTFDFEPGPAFNVVAPVPPVVCITPFNPCVSVPMSIARTDAIGVRGYTVTLQLSSNLALCNGLLSDVTQGTYLSAVGGTNFQVVDNGGGSYTVDCAILGPTLGATTDSGTLFTLNLKNVGGDGVGTVTVTSVGLRNPVNVAVPGDPGAPANITIDNTAPSAVSGLTAAQQLSGNPTGSTTNINLSWSPVPAGATVTLFRKAFGGYPEYTGSAPGAPGSYPPAGWSMVASLPSGTTSYTDPAGNESESINFESPTYGTGNINGQDGWSRTGSYDMVVDGSFGRAGFDAQSLRISDAYTSGSFGDMTFAKPLVNAVGEATATAGAFSVGARRSHFEVEFDLASVLATLQSGMHFSMSPDRGDGSRMSYLRFEDWADGIHVFFDDVQGTSNPANFVETDIATLSRTPHRIRLAMTCVNGPSNDVVQVFIDGALKITGTSWENYYRYDSEASSEQSTRIVKTVLFRTSGTANLADLGKGFLVDNLTLSSSGLGTRDFWYYTAYVNDPCGNFSGPATMTSGTLNYHLGDVAGGGTCVGNNSVDGLDISLLGAHYGKGESWITANSVECLDVGPSTDNYVDGRPVPDDKINFEDLILFSINFSVVSVPQMSAVPAADRDEVTVDAPASVSVGQTFDALVRMSGAGTVQGLSAQLGWDAAVAEPVGMEPGDLISGQNGVVFSARPGNVDAALLGANRGIKGAGVVARVTFRALASGKPNVALSSLDARNSANQKLELGRGLQVPQETALMPVAPNPFRTSPTLAFAMSKAGPVNLAVYSVDGRLVRTLVKGTREAGAYRMSWDGTDDHGTTQRAGMYFVRLVTAQGRFTRTMVMVK